ncbi:MAG TPA: DUF6717 family protein [Flavisolibacter sp.]|jgi:hypothetical protein|nr:DUF6717 family protein [Flavisolibacter sp.]
MKQHRFYREGGGWYIDLPEYLEDGGSKGDLAMVAGADTMLDIVAGTNKDVTLQMDVQPFEGGDELRLTQLCEPSMGGGYYYMKSFEGNEVAQSMWLCDVTTFVFGYMPERIYVKRCE